MSGSHQHKITTNKSTNQLTISSCLVHLLFFNNGHLHFSINFHSQNPNFQSIQQLPNSTLHFSPFLKNLHPQFLQQPSTSHSSPWFHPPIGSQSPRFPKFIPPTTPRSQSIHLQSLQGSKNRRIGVPKLPESQTNPEFSTHKIHIAQPNPVLTSFQELELHLVDFSRFWGI